MYKMSDGFKAALRSPVQQVVSKIELLDSDMRLINSGTFFSQGASEFQDALIDGNIDVDILRGTRRTGSITLLNQAGQLTPDRDPDYDGLFYVNRYIRVYRGLVIGGRPEFIRAGTFMVDSVDTIVERNMSLINITLSDPWKKLTKSLVTANRTYAAGTPFVNVVRDFAAYTGADYPLRPIIDPMSVRSTSSKILSEPFTLERGDNRGDKLKELATTFGIDIFFDTEGRLTTNDRYDPKDKQEVWHFYSTPSETENGMLLSIRRTISDDGLYNHLLVIGLGNEEAPVTFEIKDEDPSSPTNIDRLGDRVRIIEDQKTSNSGVVMMQGKRMFANRFSIVEDSVIDTVCHPALEGDDVIRITDPYFSKMNDLYRIVQMNIPLTTSKQTIHVARLINAGS